MSGRAGPALSAGRQERTKCPPSVLSAVGAAAWLVGTGSILAPSGYWALLLGGSLLRHMSLSMHSPSILIPGSGVTPGEGTGYPFQYFCLGNPMDGGAWRATVHGVTKSQARLSTWRCLFFLQVSRRSSADPDGLGLQALGSARHFRQLALLHLFLPAGNDRWLL